jgi:mRNA interferase RelE/StbE
MSYTIEIKKTAYKELANLPKSYYKLISEHINALAIDPFPNGSIKLKGTDNVYRVRVGTYRIIYEVQSNKLIVTIIKVGHRGDVYR